MQSLRAVEGEEASDDTEGEGEGLLEEESSLREERALDNPVAAERLR